MQPKTHRRNREARQRDLALLRQPRHLHGRPATRLQSPRRRRKSVYRRFEAGPVLLYDRMDDYRPDNMRLHIDFRQYFDWGPPHIPQYVADDIEQKWKNAGYVGRL